MILGGLAGFNLVLFSKIAGVLCGVGTILMTYLLGRELFGKNSFYPGIAAFLLGAIFSFGYWSVAGLETAAFAFAATAAFYFYCRRSAMLPAILILATLLRPEGGLVFAFLLLYEIIHTRRSGKYAVYIAVIYLTSLVPYLFFKLVYLNA